jgi:hypothetical protein
MTYDVSAAFAELRRLEDRAVAVRGLAELAARVHKASDDEGRPGHCAVCGQAVRRVPGGHGPTWVHADSGAVAAPNPPLAGP